VLLLALLPFLGVAASGWAGASPRSTEGQATAITDLELAAWPPSATRRSSQITTFAKF
jgi:hypothetical protein